MLQFYATVASLICFTALLLAGVDHALHPRATRSHLSEQKMWAPALLSVVYVGVVVPEILIGGVGLLAVALPAEGFLVLPALQLAALTIYLGFAAYSWLLLRWRPEAPCACSSLKQGVSRWTVVRAVALAGLAFAALGLADSAGVQVGWFQTSITLLAAAGLLVVLWRLPDAMPERRLRAS